LIADGSRRLDLHRKKTLVPMYIMVGQMRFEGTKPNLANECCGHRTEHGQRRPTRKNIDDSSSLAPLKTPCVLVVST